MTDKNPIEDLKEIRKMMESSSKFLSLSGLSGIFAGIVALVGAWIAQTEIDHFELLAPHFYFQGTLDQEVETFSLKLVFIALGILVTALSLGVLFTWLKARRQQKKLWTPLSLKLIISLMVPLAFGGLFCIGLYYRGITYIIPAATLIFYGLALLNGSKYVHVDIKYLALCEMALGVIAIFDQNPLNAIYYWAIGFGVLHIVYGAVMYFKYDRN